MRPLIFAALLAALAFTAPSDGQTSGYHLIRKVPLPGAVRWDYLVADPARRRLFIAHAAEVLVVDTDSSKVVGRIQNTWGVHGIALAPEVGLGYTSNGHDSSVTIFDLKSLQSINRVQVTGQNPDAIVYDSVTRRVFTMNGGSANATALDAATGHVIGSIDLGGRPEFAVADGRGRLFVNLEDRDSLASLDTRTLALQSRWPVPSCHQPTAMALARKQRQLFIGCRNRILAILDADGGNEVTTLPIGAGVDGVVFDSTFQRALSANGDGTLTVVAPDPSGRYRVIQTVSTASGARTLALDAVTHHVFLVTARFAPASAATPAGSRPQPVPDTFTLLEYGP
jgi:DNA-binding beta-propeller fold protein YncE